MSRKDDEECLLHTLATEGGQLTFSSLTDDGILAASRLTGVGRVWTGTRAEGWNVLLAQREPGS